MTNIVTQETLNNVLVEVLKGTKDASHEIYGASKAGIVKAVDFASEQAPIVVQEFVRWHFVDAITIILFCIVGIIACVWAFKKVDEWPTANYEDRNAQGLAAFILVVFGTVCSIFLFVETRKAVKIAVAPRVYVVEWVADTIKAARR